LEQKKRQQALDRLRSLIEERLKNYLNQNPDKKNGFPKFPAMSRKVSPHRQLPLKSYFFSWQRLV